MCRITYQNSQSNILWKIQISRHHTCTSALDLISRLQGCWKGKIVSCDSFVTFFKKKSFYLIKSDLCGMTTFMDIQGHTHGNSGELSMCWIKLMDIFLAFAIITVAPPPSPPGCLTVLEISTSELYVLKPKTKFMPLLNFKVMMVSELVFCVWYFVSCQRSLCFQELAWSIEGEKLLVHACFVVFLGFGKGLS